MDGGPAGSCMGQDLDYNTVIVYFTADDLIGFSPSVPKRKEKEGRCVCGDCLCVSVNACVDMGVGYECALTASLSVWEWKILAFDGRSHKVWSRSHISSTRWGSESTQRRGGGVVGFGMVGGGNVEVTRLIPPLLLPFLPQSLHQVPHPVPGESGAGWGPGLSTPASGLCAQGEVTWLAYTMALSQFQPRLLQRWALPVPLQALPVLGVAAQTVRLPSEFWNAVELLVASLAV